MSHCIPKSNEILLAAMKCQKHIKSIIAIEQFPKQKLFTIGL